MKQPIEITNQIFTPEKKIEKTADSSSYLRHTQRIREALEEPGVTYHNSAGEKYSDTRTDIEANLTGEPSENMKITDVIKPIIMQNGKIIQTAIVIVGS